MSTSMEVEQQGEGQAVSDVSFQVIVDLYNEARHSMITFAADDEEAEAMVAWINAYYPHLRMLPIYLQALTADAVPQEYRGKVIVSWACADPREPLALLDILHPSLRRHTHGRYGSRWMEDTRGTSQAAYGEIRPFFDATRLKRATRTNKQNSR